MQLQSSPKIYGKGLHRVISPAETLRRVRPLMPVLGVTRTANITGLDRIGIPTYSAVMPDTKDVLSVYNGKGATKTDALVGALMEASERFSALRLDQPLHYGSYRELCAVRQVLNPETLILGLHPEYDETRELAWVEGFDLIGQHPILVPAQAVSITFEERFGHPCYTFSTTNGLASGNTVEEAVCHALCELIERDAWTIASLLAHHLPRAKRRAAATGAGAAPPAGDEAADEDDIERYPVIDLGGAGALIKGLLNKFRRAGLEPLVKDLTSDTGIPVVLATVVEHVGPEFPLAHFGLGAHPDAEIAVRRALTEVAQCRAVDIQAVREDISQPSQPHHPYAAHTKRKSRVSKNSWYYKASGARRKLGEMCSYTHGDILDDIQLMLDRLRRAGVRRAVVVNLTKPEINIPVVRVLAPGVESWAGDGGRLGWRAAQHWRANGGGGAS